MHITSHLKLKKIAEPWRYSATCYPYALSIKTCLNMSFIDLSITKEFESTKIGEICKIWQKHRCPTRCPFDSKFKQSYGLN